MLRRRDFAVGTDILKYLREFAYKPGHVLSFYRDDDETVVFRLDARVPDSTRSDQKPTTITYSRRYAARLLIDGSRELVGTLLYEFLLAWERHEMDEWFRHKSTLVRDPHAGDPR